MQLDAGNPNPRPDPLEDREVSARLRSPALLLAASIAVGILGEQWVPRSILFWFLIGVTGAIGSWLMIRPFPFRAGSLAGLLIAAIAWGGIRQHQAWTAPAQTDVFHIAEEHSIPVRLRGQLVTVPELRVRKSTTFVPAWQANDSLSMRVRCSLLNETVPVTGLVQVTIAGDWIDAEAGDEIDLWGQLSQPSPPRNPGEFDFADWLRRQGVSGMLHCEHPRQVQRVGSGPFNLRVVFARWRARCRTILQQHLSPENEVVASALLLGVRTSLDEDLKQAFVSTGTMHLLAISGLHVGLVAWLVIVVCRVLNFSARTQFWICVLSLVCYAGMTELRSSVFRATVFLILFLIAGRNHRKVNGFQILGVTACLLLSLDPPALFDVGAQLSFSAVAAILHVQPWLRGIDRSRTLFEQASIGLPVASWLRCVWFLRRWLLKGLLIGTSVWLCTLPLSTQAFHLVAPGGILLTLLLIPVVTGILGLGLGLIALGLVVAPLAFLPALLLDQLLTGIQWAVTQVALWPGVWWRVPELPGWWEFSYYGLLLALFVALRSNPRVGLLVLTVWIVTGGVIAWNARTDGQTRVTFLAVGHGGAIVIETPDNRVIVYDAGSLDGGVRSARALQSYLSLRGHSTIDLLLISHADSDHYSAVPVLLSQFTVRAVGIAPQFLTSTETPVRELTETIRQGDSELRILQAGDVAWEESHFRIGILHPDPAAEYQSENAASLVAHLQVGRRSILLAGDLERDGLDELLRQKPLDVDVLLSPHHGSPGANPPELAGWSTPEFVVVSAGERVQREVLRDSFGPACEIKETQRTGAVTVEVRSDGRLRVNDFLANER